MNREESDDEFLARALDRHRKRRETGWLAAGGKTDELPPYRQSNSGLVGALIERGQGYLVLLPNTEET